VAEDGFMAATIVPGGRTGVAGGPIEPELAFLAGFLETADMLKESAMSTTDAAAEGGTHDASIFLGGVWEVGFLDVPGASAAT
jgi:hypothetical protein